MPDALSILQVCTFDRWGGAEAVASGLTRALLARGHRAGLAVGWELDGGNEQTYPLPRERQGNAWAKLVRGGGALLGAHDRSVLVDRAASPGRALDWWRGRESFRFPGSRGLLDAAPFTPGLLHLHNLHGNYFDLRELPGLSRAVPTVLTAHDAWLMTGHCAHPFGCGRWESGCGQCPDLTTYPPLRRDGTAGNWRRKRAIYERCRLSVAAPCRWLMDRIERSILMPGVIDTRVIPNGVDLDRFKPDDAQAARAALGLPADADLLLFAASGLRSNPFKDYQTLQRAVERLGQPKRPRKLVLVALGEEASDKPVGHAEIRFVPFEQDPDRVADYFRAADLYLHAAKADTFPGVVLEALACGTPVVATAVGGIPEQVRCLSADGPGRATGRLVPPGDDAALAQAIGQLLDDAPMRNALADNATRDARERFGLDRQVDRYIDWYRERIEAQRAGGVSP